MADPTWDTPVSQDTGAALQTSVTSPSFTPSGTQRAIGLAVVLANTASQTVDTTTPPVFSGDGQAFTFHTAINNGTSDRIEIWKLYNPAALGGNVTVTFTAGVRAIVVVQPWSNVDTDIFYPDTDTDNVITGTGGAKQANITINTTESTSWAILAKRNSTVTPADSKPNQTHLISDVTTNGAVGNNIQVDADRVDTVVDVDDEAVPTPIGWQWTADTSTRAFAAIALAVQGFGSSGISPATENTALPRGIVALVAARTTINANLLTDASIRCIGIRDRWRQFQPTETTYDTSYFDTAIASAQAAGKSILLRVNTGSGTASSHNYPAWAVVGVQMFTNQDPSMPVPWDALWIQRKKDLQTYLAGRYGSNPAVVGVSCAVLNWKNDDWNVPHNIADGDREAWALLGYSQDLMINAAKEHIDHVMSVWPTQTVFLPVSTNGQLDPTQSYLADIIAAWAYDKYCPRFRIVRNSLNAQTPHRANAGTGDLAIMARYADTGVGFQMLWFVANDTSYKMNQGVADTPDNILSAAIAAGASYSAQWIEVYSQDLRSIQPTATHPLGGPSRSSWEGTITNNPSNPTCPDTLARSLATDLSNYLRIPTSNTTESAKLYGIINDVYREVWGFKDWNWLIKSEVINTEPRVIGRISVTNGSSLAVLATPNTALVGRVLTMFGDQTDYRARYRIVSSDGLGNISFDAPFTGATNATGLFRAYKDAYDAPADLGKILKGKRFGRPLAMEPVDLRQMSDLKTSDASEGKPAVYCLVDHATTGDPTTRRQLLVHPFPDRSYRLEIVYKQQLNTELGDSSIPLFPDEFKQVILYGCLALGYPIFMSDTTRGQQFSQLYQDRLRLMAGSQPEYDDDRPQLVANVRPLTLGSSRRSASRGHRDFSQRDW